MTEEEYAYTIDYLNEQVVDYLHRAAGEMAEHMKTNVRDVPELSDRLRGYCEAIEDVQKLFTPGHRIADYGLKRHLLAARQESRGTDQQPPTSGE